MPGTPKTFVHIALKATSENQTQVTLTHEGWDQFPPGMVRPFHDQLKSGWQGHVLPGLKRCAENVAPARN